MKIAFDFGITNTDIACDLDGEISYFSFPSEDVNFYFIEKLLIVLKNIMHMMKVMNLKLEILFQS